MISHSEQLSWQLLPPCPRPGGDFLKKISVQKRFSVRRCLCLGKGSSCSNSCGYLCSSLLPHVVVILSVKPSCRIWPEVIKTQQWVALTPLTKLYFLFRLSVCVAKSDSNCSCPTFMIWIAWRFGFWVSYLKLMCFFQEEYSANLAWVPMSGELHVLHPTFLCWHYSAGRAGIRCRALSLLLSWYVTLLSVPLPGVTQCQPCGGDTMWQTQTSSGEWSCLQVGLGPWCPALLPPSWQSTTTTTCSIQAQGWQESHLLQRVPGSTREIPQPSKACVWGPALAGNQHKEARGSLMSWEWDLAGLKVTVAGDISPWDGFCFSWVFQQPQSTMF